MTRKFALTIGNCVMAVVVTMVGTAVANSMVEGRRPTAALMVAAATG